ncbi:hypothetical protein NL108_009641 [Boleophthalmus pectinirostris]|nr:hypothetical protein NL108_009641 [Boleophthalmus pectinirostris]
MLSHWQGPRGSKASAGAGRGLGKALWPATKDLLQQQQQLVMQLEHHQQGAAVVLVVIGAQGLAFLVLPGQCAPPLELPLMDPLCTSTGPPPVEVVVLDLGVHLLQRLVPVQTETSPSPAGLLCT